MSGSIAENENLDFLVWDFPFSFKKELIVKTSSVSASGGGMGQGPKGTTYFFFV